jgi:hypothetical protein
LSRRADRRASHRYGGSRQIDTSVISPFCESMMEQMPTSRMASGTICCEKAWTTGDSSSDWSMRLARPALAVWLK